MKERISIVIPAFNAASTIGGVIERISPALWKSVRRVYLIDDGSLDDTVRIIQGIAADHRQCVVLHHERNLGYGSTVKQGLAKCRDDGCRYAVCLHADGQYPPESILEFVSEMEKGAIDLLQGSRIASGTAISGGMPFYKFVAGAILTMIENRVFGISMTDYHSGFIMYGRRPLETIRFDRLSGSFDFDLEMIASARAAKLVIGELPIPTRYAGEKSHLNPLTYGLRVLRVVIRYALGYYATRIERPENGK